jgi:hypothetical protein
MAFDSKRHQAEEQEQVLRRTHPTGVVRIRSVEHPSTITDVTCAVAARHIVDGTAVVMPQKEVGE